MTTSTTIFHLDWGGTRDVNS